MRLLLIISVTCLILAGCAGDYDKQADANLCEPATPESQAVRVVLVPTLGVPGIRLLEASKLDPDNMMTYACIDSKNNKTNAPRVPNLNKIRLDHLSSVT
jgi:hypothetical protein